MATKLAIIGGGPKAAAIAAKASALTKAGRHSFEITVFEKKNEAAAWDGQHGYTDGLQSMCTPAERDVGFPYDKRSFGNDVAAQMLRDFSWQSFKIQAAGDGMLSWVARGRKPPSHADFANYIRFVLDRSGRQLVASEVSELEHHGVIKKWSAKAGGQTFQGFDGIVITGPGPALPHLSGANSAFVFNGEDFWSRLEDVTRLVGPPDAADFAAADNGVVIIGSGGTAGAIANWFLRKGYTHLPITIIGREATLFSRRPNYFEDRFFGNSDDWDELDWESRRKITDRLGRGFLWEEVTNRLEQAGQINYLCASAQKYEIRNQEYHLVVERGPIKPGESVRTLDVTARVFIDARGFDGWWFHALIPRAHWPDLHNPKAREALSANMNDALAFSSGSPRLHVPMLAIGAGLAAPNLMALGWMADKILKSYIP